MPVLLGGGPAGSGSPPASAPRALCAEHLCACLTLGHIHAFSLTSPQSCKAGEMTTHFTDEKTEAQRGHVPCGKPHSYKVAEPQIREKVCV